MNNAMDNNMNALSSDFALSKEYKLANKYMPLFMKDAKEPFDIKGIGYTVFYEDGQSSSCRRSFHFKDFEKEGINVGFMIEYAIYFDFDIQHLYDLEHVFVYVGEDDKVCAVEASFHGKFFNSMLPYGEALKFYKETRPVLYMQPGKHALMPDPKLFYLFPHYETSCNELAGSDGLLIPYFLENDISKEKDTDVKVKTYIADNYAFTPSFVFEEYDPGDDVLMPWKDLKNTIIMRINNILSKIDDPIPK
ncbi:MAG: hypothetical protein K6G87_18645 [Butyrivibrio sp.]|uniref:hypothetical protein n=1 Tax=Butyrivibrio sp. TaxID=28121 RepID=UPI0025EE497E|nr:hypothetical protein [Butyrivibrio sp.]MCR5773246.1 hypothetical protein [Butyrivibrio sp.]